MYRELDDEKILYMIMEDDEYYDVIFKKYQPLVVGICKNYLAKAKGSGYELEDLIQVANLAIFEAIYEFQTNKNVLFYTFVLQCIHNKLKTELRNQFTNKKIVLNHAISYDELIKGTNYSLLDVLKNPEAEDPTLFLMIREFEIEYTKFLNSLPFEVAVMFELKMNGFTAREISKFLEITEEKIFQQIRKVKKELLSKLSKNICFSS